MIIEYFKKLSLTFALVTALLTIPIVRSSAQLPQVSKSGPITVTFKSSEVTPSYLIYYSAIATMKNGTRLEGDTLKAFLNSGAASKGKSKLSQITAKGNVKAVILDVVGKTTYTDTATSDEGVYDPTANTIQLSGNVVITVYSAALDGPMTQTGTSATIYLGPANDPSYPKLDVQQGHTTLTVKQQKQQ